MRRSESEPRGDVVLSSGFLGFASHLGFLQALGEASFGVDALVGTSSGALVASLFAANMDVNEIQRLLTASAPIAHVRPCLCPWRGLFDLEPLVRLLERELPPTFDGLKVPFGVGVTNALGKHHLITSGSLPIAVAASCAVPRLFSPIRVDGALYRDGGASDRVGVSAWRSWRPNRMAVVHQIQRSMGVQQSTNFEHLEVVVSPRSRILCYASETSEAERRAARIRTSEVLGAGLLARA